MNNLLHPMLATVIVCALLTASGTAAAQSSSDSTFSLSFGDALQQM